MTTTQHRAANVRRSPETATFRAAYWISWDRQAEYLLTDPEHLDLPDDELLAVARAEAGRTEIEMAGGEIEIGDWVDGLAVRIHTNPDYEEAG